MSDPTVTCPDCKQQIPISKLTEHYAAHKSGTLTTTQTTTESLPTKRHKDPLFTEKLLDNPLWGPILRHYWFHLVCLAFVIGWLFGARWI